MVYSDEVDVLRTQRQTGFFAGRLCLLDHRVSPGAQNHTGSVFARPLTASFGAETTVCVAGQLR